MLALKSNLQNKIINGGFDFWQRGTSFPTQTTSGYIADRFKYVTGGLNYTLDRSLLTPNDDVEFSLLATSNDTKPSLAAGEFGLIQQLVEGYVFRDLKDKNITLSFYVRSSVTGTYSVAFKNGATDRTLIKEYTINQADTWERKEITLTHDSSGTWNYTNGVGLEVAWAYACGSTFSTSTLDTWQSGIFVASTNQTNLSASSGNEFRITGIMLHEGVKAQPFQRAGRNYAEELQLCQRYYEKSYDIDTAVGTVTNTGIVNIFGSSFVSGATMGTVFFKTTKRVNPSVIFYSYNGQQNRCSATNIVDQAANSCIPLYGGDNSVAMLNSSGLTISNNAGFIVHYTADAEL